MNKITEIVYGNSMYHTISNSKLNKNKIIKFNTIFSVGNLEEIDKYKITVPKYILEDNVYDFHAEINSLDDSINNNHMIRIWCSRYDVNSYILMLFICDYLKDKTNNISVVFSDEYPKEFNLSPAVLKEDELENATKIALILSDEEIHEYANEWHNIKDKACDMRIMEDKHLHLVSYNYYDDLIINEVKSLAPVEISTVAWNFYERYYLNDLIFFYLINRLIDDGIILVIEKDKREFDSVITTL